jgi:hypothetical protein
VCLSLSVSLCALTLFSFLVLILLNDWESEGSNSRTRSQMTHSQLSLALSELQARISSVLLLSREATAATARTVTSSTKSSRSSVSSTAATATAEILDCVGFIYSNDCNAAFKVSLSSPLSSLLHSDLNARPRTSPVHLSLPCIRGHILSPPLVRALSLCSSTIGSGSPAPQLKSPVPLRLPSTRDLTEPPSVSLSLCLSLSLSLSVSLCRSPPVRLSAGSLPPKVVAAISDLLCSISGD